ncbi:sensor histidine kinase, partial [Metabacillus niabensis]
QINIDPEASKCLIPNMSLIPFVENASIHGIEPIKGKGMISISIKRENDRLVFEVNDNGQGMEKNEYEQLLGSLEEVSSIGEHVGIKNVYYRLKLHYSNQFDFSIVSNKGIGTTVKIQVPFFEHKY